MSRKTSVYAAKQRRQGNTYNGAEWLNTLQRCKPYSDDAPIGGLFGTQSAATKAMLIVRQAFEALKSGTVPANDVQNFDKLSHAMGVACIRAAQIAGEDVANNIMLPTLITANSALMRCMERRRRLGSWGLDGPAITELTDAIEIFETIVQASSPAQMTNAVDYRNQMLKGQTLETLQ